MNNTSQKLNTQLHKYEVVYERMRVLPKEQTWYFRCDIEAISLEEVKSQLSLLTDEQIERPVGKPGEYNWDVMSQETVSIRHIDQYKKRKLEKEKMLEHYRQLHPTKTLFWGQDDLYCSRYKRWKNQPIEKHTYLASLDDEYKIIWGIHYDRYETDVPQLWGRKGYIRQ